MLLHPLSHIALLFASCMFAQPALQVAGSIIIPPEGIPPDGDIIIPPEGIPPEGIEGGVDGACVGGGVEGGGGDPPPPPGGGPSCAIK